MKKIKIILLVLALIVILGAGLLIYKAAGNKNSENQEAPQDEFAKNNVFLKINFGTETLDVFSREFKENYTAFDLLKEASLRLGFPIGTKSYDIGVLIESINGVEGGKDNKYWMYYVNGELPMIAADKNYLKAGDKVEFKFEESKF